MVAQNDSDGTTVLIDRDTEGRAGSPHISETILEKIDQCDLFVADVSIVGKLAKKPCPNPNVLLELGYAIRSLGSERVIMVMNKHFGGPEVLPFDLKHRRAVTFKVEPDAGDKAEERARLVRTMADAFRMELQRKALQPQPPPVHALGVERAVEAIKSGAPSRPVLIDEAINQLWAELDRLSPAANDYVFQFPDDALVQALEASVPVVKSFGEVIYPISTVDYHDGVTRVFQGFGHLLGKYVTRHDGVLSQANADYYRFLGHEMFVMMISGLLRRSRWATLEQILGEDLYLSTGTRGQYVAGFDSLSEYLNTFRDRDNRTRANRISLHADYIYQRHTEEPLKKIVPMIDFIEADFLLYLRTDKWRPWSTPYIGTEAPRFLFESKRASKAVQLLPVLSIDRIDALQERVAQRKESLSGLWHHSVYPLLDFDIGSIAST